MQRAIVLGLLFYVSVTAIATDCNAGYKVKKDIAGIFCATSAADAKSCSASCCVLDDKKCGGLTVTTTDSTKYCQADVTPTEVTQAEKDANKAAKDAWANKPATEKTKVANCCVARATCGGGGFTIPAGMKLKTASSTTKCPRGPKSCVLETNCFERDPAKCGGWKETNTDLGSGNNKAGTDATKWNAYCTGGTAPNLNLADTFTAPADKAWLNSATTDGKACCSAKATCGSKFYTCSVGTKYDKTKKDTLCDSTAATCDTTTGAKCCAADPLACQGQADLTKIACPANKYYPKDKPFWQTRATTATTQNADCCITKATCKLGVCNAGYKKKAGSDDLSCATDATSCGDVTKSPSCCEKDLTTCGGNEGTITCAKGFFDESTTWAVAVPATKQAVKDAWRMKPATAATKDTACCTGQAACSATPGATTTPPATTTPSSPLGRLYSERGPRAPAGPQGSANMVWLAAGALIGMGVVMVAQRLRSSRIVDTEAIE